MKPPIASIKVKLIGLTGAKGCGKDTCARYLRDNYYFAHESLAKPIKLALCAMYNVPMELFEDPELKEKPDDRLLGKTPRFLMVTLGTEWGRDVVSPSLWLDLLLLRVEALRRENTSIVVSDVRFDNEAASIKARGGHIWLIERDTKIYSDSQHRSEKGIDRDLVDFAISNTADLRMLYAQIGVGLGHIDKHIAVRSHDGSTQRALPPE